MNTKYDSTEKFESLNEGDKIVFNGRKQACEVVDVLDREDEAEEGKGRMIEVETPKGKCLMLQQSLKAQNHVGIIKLSTTRQTTQGMNGLEVVG